MAFKCPVPGCEDSEKEFRTEAALKSHIRKAHPNMKEGKHMDIIKKASYGTYDKVASR